MYTSNNTPNLSPRFDNEERNDKILLAVMRGWTLKQVGSIFNLTPPRVRGICVTTSRYFITEFSFKRMMIKWPAGGSIQYLRKNYGNRIISGILAKLEDEGGDI